MKHSNARPVIGITMGDPVGIGPEILVKALNDSTLYAVCKPLILGDSHIIKKALSLLNISKNINIIDDPEQGQYQSGTLDIMDISTIDTNKSDLSYPTVETGTAMQKYITCAIDLALADRISGLVTCPITKTAMKLAGSQFHGHTELLAHRTNAEEYAMMLTGNKLKVILVTIHIPLSLVSASLTTQGILKKIRLAHTSLKDRFNIPMPNIAVAGLNPHAGEESMFGREEEDIISPAVRLAKEEGLKVTGPLPPDTVFYQAVSGRYDAVICMYHDQGLIPFKLIHFKDGVNTTLGLSIIRTSVDHGTAYDIAWKGIADPSSLIQAVKTAAFQAQNRKRELIENEN
ncbi:4-hydroxythreonine-4-phosphate dehydrogenase PdxA [Desulfobacula phenolica]|uniref:4-hydroxythreonine-4-phosphate dehydrogenase n=1 Tax=Desulfobacula phenolica TaxID=90732 RepID=A0A1H2EQX6_9BACT|nr:4-hydroxythreonine-4-phosphate dehydrogenase PdxA [Desulfobacula phenolica]SDT97491.1 4-hydroxythreonine-4-phosphate dehydrogenase [Desulfobacula phenolica]